jgi:hypothetical protein
MSGTTNPYAPPKAQVEDVVPFAGEADAIRREHIKTEASIRSVGILYYIGGGALIIAAIFMSLGLAGRQIPGFAPGLAGLLSVFFLAFGVASIFVGRGLRDLRPWARITAIVLTILGLIRPSAGIIINIYILYLLFSKKGRRIFESDYPDIVAATPDVKYKTSVIIWILLGIIVLAIVAALVVPALGRHR